MNVLLLILKFILFFFIFIVQFTSVVARCAHLILFGSWLEWSDLFIHLLIFIFIKIKIAKLFIELSRELNMQTAANGSHEKHVFFFPTNISIIFGWSILSFYL